MTDIRLFMFQSGSQRCKLHDIKMNQGNGADYEIPVPWFLLTHPKGHVIIDGGLAVEGLADPRDWWGDAVDAYIPIMEETEGCIAQIARLGIGAEDIRFVALSHLHSDHSGAIGRFPRATHIVQRREYEYAFTPDWFAAAAYARKDFDRPGLDWRFLDGDTTDGHDLYGDGVLRMIFTPGHTVGHQAFSRNPSRNRSHSAGGGCCLYKGSLAGDGLARVYDLGSRHSPFSPKAAGSCRT